MTTPVQRNVARYIPLSHTELHETVNALRNIWHRFWDVVEYNNTNWSVNISNHALAEIAVRVDKRAQYYSYFHEGMNISERKRAGLYAYWIVKFRPFTIILRDNTIVSPEEKLWISAVNEKFAAFFLYAGILEYSAHLDGPSFLVSNASKASYHNALEYALRFRHISIDAMMLLVETMTPADFDRVVDRV